LPVDDEINLDNPEGLTQNDIDRMVEQAEELRLVAENSEKSAETIKKNLKVFEKRSFKEIDAMTGEAKELDVNNMDTLQLKEQIATILEQLLEAKEARAKNEAQIKQNKLLLERQQTTIQRLENEIQGAVRDLDSNIATFQSATNNPLGFGKGKIIGMVGKAGVYGAIALFVYKMVEQYWESFKDSFKAGGANDIRKLMEDRDREMMELSDIVDRRAGRVFFTETTTLRQGSPNFSNTENLADQVSRYQLLHLGGE
jgi:chromosome segregation ATPase